MGYIVYGAGGHAKVVVDILIAGKKPIIGIIDDSHHHGMWRGFPLLGDPKNIEAIINQYPHAKYIIGIGSNQVRQKIVNDLDRFGISWGRAIHPSCVIGSNVSIGEGTVVMPGCVINADSLIGNHVIVNTAVSIDHDNQINHFSHLSPGVRTAGNVTISQSVHLGIGCSVIPGVHISNNTIVGASSCVTKDLPGDVVAVGCPAKVIKYMNKGDDSLL